MPLLFLRSAASLFRRGTPQKNNPQPPRPGVSLYHTSRARSSHAGISPTNRRGGSDSMFHAPACPHWAGDTQETTPNRPGRGSVFITLRRRTPRTRGSLPQKAWRQRLHVSRSSLSPLGGERQRTTPSRPGRGSIFITLRKRTPRTRGSLPQKAWGRCPASGSSPPPPP